MKKILVVFSVALIAIISACSSKGYNAEVAKQVLSKEQSWTADDVQTALDQCNAILDECEKGGDKWAEEAGNSEKVEILMGMLMRGGMESSANDNVKKAEADFQKLGERMQKLSSKLDGAFDLGGGFDDDDQFLGDEDAVVVEEVEEVSVDEGDEPIEGYFEDGVEAATPYGE